MSVVLEKLEKAGIEPAWMDIEAIFKDGSSRSISGEEYALAELVEELGPREAYTLCESYIPEHFDRLGIEVIFKDGEEVKFPCSLYHVFFGELIDEVKKTSEKIYRNMGKFFLDHYISKIEKNENLDHILLYISPQIVSRISLCFKKTPNSKWKFYGVTSLDGPDEILLLEEFLEI